MWKNEKREMQGRIWSFDVRLWLAWVGVASDLVMGRYSTIHMA